MKSSTIIYVVFFAIAIAWISYLWTPDDRPKAFIESQGFTEVEVGTLSFFGCRKEVGYSFRAKKDGKEVSGAVCNSFIIFGTNVIRLY